MAIPPYHRYNIYNVTMIISRKIAVYFNIFNRLSPFIVTLNRELRLKGNSDAFECIGVGTDAAVFRFLQMPHLAFKVFSDDKLDKKDQEIQVYLKLGRSEYYPEYYGSGSNFLVISYEEGITLHDCLLKDIQIPQQVIRDVDNARHYASKKGLNPRDIHFEKHSSARRESQNS